MRPWPALLLAGALAGSLARADETPRKLDTIAVESGFIDDPFDFSDDGTQIAYITTDGADANGTRLHFARIGSKEGAAEVPYPSITPERVDFLDAERVLVVERNPDTRLVRGQIFTAKGPTKDKYGPADDIVLATVGGAPAIVTYLHAEKSKGGATHTLAAFRASDGKSIGKKVLTEDGEGRISFAGGRFKLLFFEDGYTELIVQKEGDFDKAHDIRKPDLAARLDVFAAKQLSEHEIKDLIAWAELVSMRRKHQNESDFVRFSEDLKKLELVDRDDLLSQLETPRPLRKYDPPTLAYEPTADKQLVMGLSIDPVNVDAVAAKKADKDWLDLFRVDVKAHTLTLLARIDGEKRPSTWHLVGQRVGVLRKHKGFARGGPRLDIYELSAAAR
jgi:hypothetical protein